MRKVITLVMALLLLAGCGSPAAVPAPTADPTTDPTTAPTIIPTATPDPTATPMVEVDEGVFTVTITVNGDYVGEKTQEELDALRQEKEYKSITLNDDGSVTYVMTKNQHRELLSGIEETINKGIDEICSSADYPGIDAITAGEEYKEFTVRLNTADLGYREMFSAVVLYGYGLIYNAYLEDGADNIHVTFINNAGEIIEEANSRDMKF